ncbi:MAG TPA: FlgD immunoglobulin-like domain containing protein [Candidatus Krumholzibacteria bacterium]|nr:FlgD immunoglobulin-like domain containing protein [Candidatus Krumholzibacteria bacterium]
MLKHSIALIVCLALFSPVPAVAASPFEGLTLVVVDAPDIASLHRARALVHENGGRIGAMVPPSIMMGWIDPATASKLVGREGIRDIRWSEVHPENFEMRDDASVSAIATYNDIVSGEYQRRENAQRILDRAGARGPDAFPREASNASDVLENLRGAGLDDATLAERGLLPQSAPDGSVPLTYADKMTGTVAVTFFLVESDGSGADPNSWTWTPQDMQEYMNSAIVGLLWWSGRADGYLDCWVTFLINHVSALDPRCQQWVEPSIHDSGFVSTWASNVMTKMGYPSGTHFSKVDAFNNWQEVTYQANSAYSAFIAYNPIGAPSSFANGGYAFAWIYGPYFWSLFRTPGWTHDVVISHETGHIFGACDEYTGGCSSCASTCSAYGGPNANCEDCNPLSHPCMMRSNENALCQYTKTMIGWDASVPCAPNPPAPLPAPTLSLLSPDDGLEGTEVTITITGSNFVAGVEAEMGPEVFVHTTTLVNSTTLTVWATVFNGATLGPVDVVVRNRDGQTATLNDAFEILPTRKHYFSPAGSNQFPYLTPASAGTSLTQVMAAATDGDTVLVPTMTFNAFSLAMDKGLTLQGAWNASFTSRNLASGKTVLDLAGIIDFYPGSAGAGIDGFLIENGDGKEDFVPVFARYAGAVRAYQTMVSIRNCEIRTSNTGPQEQTGYGGAIYGYQSAVTIANCHIHDNRATKGGAMYLDQCSASISGSTIEYNTVVTTGGGQPDGSGVQAVGCTNVTLANNNIGHHSGGQNGGGVLIENSTGILIDGGVLEYNSASFGGGGMDIRNSSGTIRNVWVRRNTAALLAGGISITNTTGCVVEKCRVEWNSATFGGGIFGSGNLTVAHNLIVGNSASSICGGLGVSSASSGSVAGNTLDRNSVGSGAGGISLSSAAIPVFNNVVTNSTGAGISCSGTAPTLLDFNNVFNASAGLYSGCTPGASSISADPLFVDTTVVDYRLAVHSPCIDRGRTGAPYNDPDGSRGDMGRYGSHTFVMDQPAQVVGASIGWSGPNRVLSWDANAEGDVAKYAVYAASTSGFAPGVANFVAFVNAPGTSYDLGAIGADTYYKVNAVDDDGYAGGYSSEVSASPPTDAKPIVYRTRLFQNSPNPFNPETEVRFELAAPANVSISIFDAAGRRVRVLIDDARPAGPNVLRWNGRDDSGQTVSSGVYFYRMRTSGFDATRKMVLLK